MYCCGEGVRDLIYIVPRDLYGSVDESCEIEIAISRAAFSQLQAEFQLELHENA